MQLQTFLMCTYQQGKQIKKKQQQSTSNCQCNAMQFWAEGKDSVRDFFYAQNQNKQQ